MCWSRWYKSQPAALVAASGFRPSKFRRFSRNPSTGSQVSLRQLVSRKKETQLKPRGVVGVRAVNGIVFNARTPLFPDRAFLGVAGIGCPHKLAQVGDGIFF